MAKRSELTAGFALGVYSRVEGRIHDEGYCGSSVCQLAEWDTSERPCAERLEAFHYVSRQRIRNTLGAPGMALGEALIVIAEWDSRNGSVACQAHHRRYDSHMTPVLRLPLRALPDHAIEFAIDWGLEAEMEAHMLGASRI